MFEIYQYDKRMHKEPPAIAETSYCPDRNIDRISLLFWSEHCTECAAPACYKTCELYQARPDMRCRRFRFGIYKNRNFSSLRGYGAEIAFKKWGRIVAAGNTATEPKSWLIWKERLIPLAARAATALGPFAYRVTRDERWRWPASKLLDRLCHELHRRNHQRSKPDAFVLEVYNPGADPLRMQLVMDYFPEGRQKFGTIELFKNRFRTTLTFPKGYCRHEFDRRVFQNFTESGLPFNISLTPEADNPARLVFLTADFVTYRNKKSAGVVLSPIKCVVWDLDNTLWEGVLLENADVRLNTSLKELLETLDQRGILLSIASKNDHESAWRQLEALGISDYFLAPQINWMPKSESIKAIAKRLNIGLDSVAFIDDNPFELNEVAAACPEVTCIDVRNVGELRNAPRFQGSTTADARSRRGYYQEALVREDKQAEFGEDYLRFLEYCEIRLEIRRFRNEDFDRVAELVQRTNQLNFSGQKYNRDQLHNILNDPEIDKYILDCSDKFGSYGTIGLGTVRHSPAEIEIQDFMLSCRVQGKLIEQAFFSHLQTHHNPKRAPRLRVNFTETARNQPARQALEAAKFYRLDAQRGFARDALGTSADFDPIQVTCLAGCNRNSADLPRELAMKSIQ